MGGGFGAGVMQRAAVQPERVVLKIAPLLNFDGFASEPPDTAYASSKTSLAICEP